MRPIQRISGQKRVCRRGIDPRGGCLRAANCGDGQRWREANGERRVANDKRRANSRHRQQAANGERQTANSGQRTADSGQRTADSEQQKVDERKPVTGGALRTFCRAAKDAATGLRKLPNLTYLCTMRRKNERYNEPVVRGVVAQLRELRHARNLSQKQVFTDTDINIGRIESGRGNISVSTLADLCAYYGIPLREFFERLEAGIASGE